MPNRLANGIFQFRPNNWSTNTSLCPTDWPTEFSSSGQTTGQRIQLVHNWSTNASLWPTDWSTEISSSCQTTNTSLCPTDRPTEFSKSGQTTGLRIPVYARPIGQRNFPVHAKQLIPIYVQPIGQRNSSVQVKQLVYEYQFMPDRLANGILQFRPNNWSTNTCLCLTDLPTEFSSSGQTSGLRILVNTQPICRLISYVQAKQLVYEYQLCPTDLPTKFSSSGQTTGLRIPVYVQPIWRLNSPVQVKQLVHEYPFMPDRLANGILQFRPNNWSTNICLCPTDLPTEFSSSGKTTCLRIPVYARLIGQRNSPVQAKQMVYEYQCILDRLVNGILQFRPNKRFMNTSVYPTDWPTEFSSSGQITGLRIQLVYNWSTNTSLCPIDWSTRFSSSGQTSGLRIPVCARPIGQRKSPVRAKQLVYEYQFMFMPNRLVNGILQFRPNNWSTDTTGLQLVYGYQFMSDRSANGILQFMPNNWSTNTTGL